MASSMSLVIVAPDPVEDAKQHLCADLVAWIEIEQLHDGGAAFREMAEPHQEIGIGLEREEIEARQHRSIIAKGRVARMNHTPIEGQRIIARGFLQTEARDLQSFRQA